MKKIKNFDLFQKIAVSNISKSTLTGSLLSISAISLIAYLIIKELFIFVSLQIVKETTIQDSSSAGEDKIKANFSMRIYNSPCALISIDKEDLSGNHVMDVKENIIKVRMSKNNAPIDGNAKMVPYKIDQLVKTIKEEEGCYINAIVEINKSPGDIHISYHNYQDVYDNLLTYHSEEAKNLKLNHKFLSLNFGEETITQATLIRYGLKDQIKAFINTDYPMFEGAIEDEEIYNYDYYLKLIQTVFVDENRNDKVTAYQFSISYTKKAKESEEEMPIIMINYDLSPIVMRFILKRKSFTHFLTNICAIIGGVFVFFSIFNRIVITLFETWSENKDDNNKIIN